MAETAKKRGPRVASVGDRVELSPRCDLWMRGAKFGEIQGINRDNGYAVIRIDHPQVKQLVAIRLYDLRFATPGAEYGLE